MDASSNVPRIEDGALRYATTHPTHFNSCSPPRLRGGARGGVSSQPDTFQTPSQKTINFLIFFKVQYGFRLHT